MAWTSHSRQKLPKNYFHFRKWWVTWGEVGTIWWMLENFLFEPCKNLLYVSCSVLMDVIQQNNSIEQKPIPVPVTFNCHNFLSFTISFGIIVSPSGMKPYRTTPWRSNQETGVTYKIHPQSQFVLAFHRYFCHPNSLYFIA